MGKHFLVLIAALFVTSLSTARTEPDDAVRVIYSCEVRGTIGMCG